MIRQRGAVDDADVAAGQRTMYEAAPSTSTSISSLATINTNSHNPNDLRFTDDSTIEPMLVLGFDVSHLSRRGQFIATANGVYWFSLLYGYLQELISVKLCHRQLGLFLAMVQFAGYTILSYWLRNFVDRKQKRLLRAKSNRDIESLSQSEDLVDSQKKDRGQIVPWTTYLGLSLLRAVDLAMTNLAMQYINYPAKTLMKSSRIIFTMLFGVLFGKKYYMVDYLIVGAMVSGLALFMHADANSDAVFDYRGVIMLTVSLLCDGAISNMSEKIMSNYGVGQDEFIFRMYSISFLAITFAAAVKGDLVQGMVWMMVPGTYDQMDLPSDQPREWSVAAKWFVIVVFSSMGFFGSSCSAAITKNFGALTMSITSTARKATTLFLSFFLFHNVCTSEHILGIVVFIAALTTKSLRRGRKRGGSNTPKHRPSSVDKLTHSRSARTQPPERNRLIRRNNSADGISLTRSGGASLSKGIHVV